VRLFASVNHLVELERVGVGKCLVAYITLVGTLIGVNAVEIRLLLMSMITTFDCCSNIPMMLIAGRQISKGCRAIAALVWPISRMRVHVTCQLLRLGKAMSANPKKKTIVLF